MVTYYNESKFIWQKRIYPQILKRKEVELFVFVLVLYIL